MLSNPLPTATPTPTGLDPTIVNVAKAIRQVESGGNFNIQGKSGEFGAYQFTEPTWNTEASKIGIKTAFNQATPEEQNAVAYHYISNLKDQGYNVGQIASIWNSGKPDPNGTVGTNSKGVAYDTPAYVDHVYNAYQQFKAQTDGTAPSPEAPPSIGGFAGNVVTSGANLLGNIGNAALHPIQTIQNIGSAGVGGLQELGGQQNENTQNFDNLVNFYKQRYGSLDQLAHTAYTDPVGVAADISSFLTGGAGALRLGARGAEAVGAVDAANAVRGAAGALTKGADLTNPLTPVVAGTGKLLGKTGGVASEVASQLTGLEPKTIDEVIANPQAFTPEQIANTSRQTIAKQVEDALGSRINELGDTGAGYSPIRFPEVTGKGGYDNIKNIPANADIPVANNFLETQLRKTAKVDIIDGKITANGSSYVRDIKDVRGLQNLFDTWKPSFQKGFLTPNEYLNFRTDLTKLAKFEREITKSPELDHTAEVIRGNLNDQYRPLIPGLEELDSKFTAEADTLKELRKGLIDKEGNLTDAAINRVANATGKGKDIQLARLEKLVPGIERKLQVLKAMEDIQKASGTKVGTYPSAFLKAGGVVAGVVTGRIEVVAAALATTIIASPEVAVPLLRVFGNNKGLMHAVLAHLARYATTNATLFRSTSQQPQSDQTEPTPPPPSDVLSSSPQPSTSLEGIASQKGFDLTAARNAGYTDPEIASFLSQ